MLPIIKSKNPHLDIKNCQSNSFKEFGRIVVEYDFDLLSQWAEKSLLIPDEIVYEPSISEMENFSIKSEIENYFYGEMPAQIGFCSGHNQKMNGMEYHKSSEIVVAVTDLMLFLGRVQDIESDRYEAHKAKVFIIPKGTAVELYATTLHLAPVQTTRKGFLALIILPKGTNTPLSIEINQSKGRTLFLKNKWMIAHSESGAAQRGAWVGIIGENPVINM